MKKRLIRVTTARLVYADAERIIKGNRYSKCYLHKTINSNGVDRVVHRYEVLREGTDQEKDLLYSQEYGISVNQDELIEI